MRLISRFVYQALITSIGLIREEKEEEEQESRPAPLLKVNELGGRIFLQTNGCSAIGNARRQFCRAAVKGKSVLFFSQTFT